MQVRYPLFLTAQTTLSFLLGQPPNWIAAGNRALYEGRPSEAATDYRQALDEAVRAGKPGTALVHLRVSLATADLEAGDIHGAEGVLQQVDEAAAPSPDKLAHAEMLNAWAAVHVLQGRWTDAERELVEARGILLHVPQSGDLLPAVHHNLAAIQMRTGAYAEALNNERDALSLWEEALNPDHPHLIKCWNALGAVQLLLGRPLEAHQSLEHAIASARKTYGPKHRIVADLLVSHAVILDRLKLKREAKLARAEARQILGGQPTGEYDRTTWNIREALAPDSTIYLRSK